MRVNSYVLEMHRRTFDEIGGVGSIQLRLRQPDELHGERERDHCGDAYDFRFVDHKIGFPSVVVRTAAREHSQFDQRIQTSGPHPCP